MTRHLAAALLAAAVFTSVRAVARAWADDGVLAHDPVPRRERLP